MDGDIRFGTLSIDCPDAARAEALGAERAPAQFGGADFVTMLDPAGHPFCLCRAN